MPHIAAEEIPVNLAKPSAPLIATCLENVDLTPDSPHDNRHIVLDLGDSGFRYLEGQSVGVVAPGVDASGKPHRLRLYSIASSRQGDDGQGKTISLLVKRTVYTDAETGQEVHGVASSFLCDLKPGDKVPLIGPSGRHFLLPAEPSANLLMIATGTGLAPFRGFLRQRDTHPRDGRGRSFLIFGAQTSKELLYQDEIRRHLNHDHDHLLYALSREHSAPDGGRMYVGHRLAELKEAVWPLVAAKDIYVYLCGIKGMETSVESMLENMAQDHGVDWAALKAELVKEKRWMVETY